MLDSGVRHNDVILIYCSVITTISLVNVCHHRVTEIFLYSENCYHLLSEQLPHVRYGIIKCSHHAVRDVPSLIL